MLAANSTLLEDPLAAVEEWEKQAATGTARVRKYLPRAQADSWAEDQIYGLYEPEGRCSH